MNVPFEVTASDIQIVLEAYCLRVTNTQGKSFETMASELIYELDEGRIEGVVRDAGSSYKAQTQAAFDEIKSALVEMNVLEF